MVINRQAVLPADRPAKKNHFHHEAGLIPADRQIMMTGQREALEANHPEKKGRLHLKAGLIPAGLPTMMKGQKEVLAINQAAKNGHFLQKASLFRRDRTTTGPKEALMGHQMEKNHLRHEVNLQQARSILMTGLKKAMAAIKQVKENLLAGHQQAAVSKNMMGTGHTAPTGRNAQDQLMTK
jgi:hypothetical protein